MFCQPGFNILNQEIPQSAPGLNYLEIGTFNGDSIAELARRNPTRTIYAIDPFIEDGYTSHTTLVDRNQDMPTQRKNTYRNIAGLDNVTLFETTSREFSETLTDQQVADMNIAWVLIDGSHHYEDVAIDVALALRLIGPRSGGIVFDDVNVSGVARAYQEFLAMPIDRSEAQDVYLNEPGHIIFHKINPGA